MEDLLQLGSRSIPSAFITDPLFVGLMERSKDGALI